jgi:hypothetical protein
MRKAIRGNPQKIPRSLTAALPAPVKGWYSQESFVDQEEDSAIVLENWFPEPDSVRARRGYTSHATGMNGNVETLFVHSSATPEVKLFAANNGAIYNVTSSGAVGAAEVSGLTNNRWQHSMLATSGGQFSFLCNGADLPLVYNGASFSNPAITGVDESTFIHVTLHKRRLWFTVKDSMSLWYLPVESIAGAAVEFPVGALFHRGGYVMATGTWSRDAGDGMDDLFVILSSEGEVAIYQGTDPSSASTWALVGNYHIGKPIGRRCLFQVGGDLAVVCEDGILPLSKAITLDRAAAVSEALTKNIRRAYAQAAQRARSVFGWQIISHPTKNMGILNVPGSGIIATQQYVINTLNGAWAKWTNINAQCWAHSDGEIYFGGTDGKVYQAEYGANDNGTAIPLRGLQAYNHLEKRGRLKHVKMTKPIYSTDVDVIPEIAIAVDYEDPAATGDSQDVDDDFLVWDVSAWDEAPWYGLNVSTNWRGAANIGTVIAPFWAMDLDAASAGSEFTFNWIGTELVFEVGGVL